MSSPQNTQGNNSKKNNSNKSSEVVKEQKMNDLFFQEYRREAVEGIEFMKRGYLFGIVLIFSVVLSLIILRFPFVYKFIFKDYSDGGFTWENIFKDIDIYDLDIVIRDGDKSAYQERWRNIIKYSLIFTVLISVMFVTIIGGIFGSMYAWKTFVENKKEKAILESFETIKTLFWSWSLKRSFGEGVNTYQTINLIVMLVATLFGFFVFFLFYTLAVKNYLKDLFYPDTQEEPEKELPKIVVFLHHYGIFIILLFIFLLGLFNIRRNSDYLSYLLYGFVMLILMVVFSISIINYMIKRDLKKYLVLSIVLIMTFVGSTFFGDTFKNIIYEPTKFYGTPEQRDLFMELVG